MIVILNPAAAAGSAGIRWRTIEAEFRRRYGCPEMRTCTTRAMVSSAVSKTASADDPRVVAAGGDGTVNAVVQAAMLLPPVQRNRLTIGAVGLGSSNDCHKPFDARDTLGGIPVRTAFAEARLTDVGKLTATFGTQHLVLYFLLNASAGLTAAGNARFNAPGPLLRFLKRQHPSAAVFVAALSAILFTRNRPVVLTCGGSGPESLSLTTLNILKNTHISGRVRLTLPDAPNGGEFVALLAEGLPIIGRLRLFQALSHGRLPPLAGVRTWRGASLSVSSADPLLVEYDGEVLSATQAEFSIVPHALRICP